MPFASASLKTMTSGRSRKTPRKAKAMAISTACAGRLSVTAAERLSWYGS